MSSRIYETSIRMGEMSSRMGEMSSRMGEMSSIMGEMNSRMGEMSSRMGEMSIDFLAHTFYGKERWRMHSKEAFTQLTGLDGMKLNRTG